MSDTPWFESWFDSPYYHKLYAHRDETEAKNFLDTLLSHLELPSDSKVLDLACGKGRHARHLADRGMVVTGLDLSENSIASLRHLNDERLHFEVWDMRKTYRKESFHAVFNLFTSFGYFEDQKDNLMTLRAIHEALYPGGRVLVDFLNVVPVLPTLPDSKVLKREGVRFNTRKFLDGEHIKKAIDIADGGTELHFEESVQALRLDDFKRLFQLAGLELEESFGDYDLNPFDTGSSPRLILLGRRPSS